MDDEEREKKEFRNQMMSYFIFLFFIGTFLCAMLHFFIPYWVAPIGGIILVVIGLFTNGFHRKLWK
jgi:putative Mn2+ efflux pump MntP